jgi:hypothetical protein
MRTFTGLPEERLFIEQLHHGTTRLDDSFPILPELVDAAIDSPEFERMVLRLCEHFDYMTKSMVKVMRAIPPHIFSGRITPFFRPVEIGGVTYPGITGAHVQLLGIDLVIYGNDTNDSVYQAYVAENLPMLLPHHKQFLKQALDKLQGESFMTRIRERLLPGDRQYDLRQASASLGALGCYLLRVLSFRHPHLKAAKDNLPLRREERGSGGYSVSTLELLIGHTRNAAETLKVWSEQFAGAPITSGFGCTHPN